MKSGSKSKNTMKKKGNNMGKDKTSLFNKMMRDEKFKKNYEFEKALFEIEYQLEKLMEDHGITQKILAERLGIDKSVVSKDMSGGLRNAGLKKLQAIAEVLDCDFFPIFVPKEHVEEFKKEIESLHFFDDVKRA